MILGGSLQVGVKLLWFSLFFLHGSHLQTAKPSVCERSVAHPRQPITLEGAVGRCDWLKLIVLRVLTEMMLRLIGL